MKIAVYGKGGIGKSTISANLSYNLAIRGLSVMQIGCDPKHDSTRLLLGGSQQDTILERIRSGLDSMDGIVSIGSGGVRCVESGGPEAGTGCAGRGILTAFNVLKLAGILNPNYDFTIFDVLGDVVCGGFAVPLREENADAVYVVTSGEFMSIYAANNLFRGMRNFDSGRPRSAGLILNRRGVEGEEDNVRRFSKAVGVPIILDIPRSDEFREAESRGMTVSEMDPVSPISHLYSSLADHAISVRDGLMPMYTPHPLDDSQIDSFARGDDVCSGLFVKAPVKEVRGFIGMNSCASRGAVFEAGRVIDLPIVVHGPTSCGYVMSHTQDGHFLEDIASSPTIIPKMRNNIVCTSMTNTSSVFGGRRELTRVLTDLAESGKKIVMVITTCVPGMVGDDVDGIVRDVRRSYPGTDFITIKADGNLSGGSEEGRVMVMDKFIDLIDPDVLPTGNAVNLVDDTFMGFNKGRNEAWTMDLLGRVDLRIGTKLFEDCTVNDIRNCRANPLSILVDGSDVNLHFASALADKGLRIFSRPLPKGFSETIDWVRAISDVTGFSDVDHVIDAIESEYHASLERVYKVLDGCRISMMCSSTTDPDWLIEAIIDSGAEVSCIHKMRVGPSFQEYPSRFHGKVRMVQGSSIPDAIADLTEDRPDIVVGSSLLIRNSGLRAASIPSEVYTHEASIAFLRYLSNMLLIDSGGWKKWSGLCGC